MVRHGKPDPETYLTASKTVGFAPEECFALEDSPNGIYPRTPPDASP